MPARGAVLRVRGCRGRELRWQRGRGPLAQPCLRPGGSVGRPPREGQLAGLARAALPRQLRAEAGHLLGG
eukprot:1068573-Alexandrium_andersonii.AAC.1